VPNKAFSQLHSHAFFTL